MTTRINQKDRTRKALLEAARELLSEGHAPSVAASAKRALISEATAYRYFTSARRLTSGSVGDKLARLAKGTEDIRIQTSVEERARFAAEIMARTVLANEAQVRALISFIVFI